mmetsp:Transcript_35674/g.45816  ORF Transcript_35674/g.45816 Transcript_35674/m.45816 type:complete len:300 (+) Transcript_35674:2409-3308(+)
MSPLNLRTQVSTGMESTRSPRRNPSSLRLITLLQNPDQSPKHSRQTSCLQDPVQDQSERRKFKIKSVIKLLRRCRLYKACILHCALRRKINMEIPLMIVLFMQVMTKMVQEIGLSLKKNREAEMHANPDHCRMREGVVKIGGQDVGLVSRNGTRRMKVFPTIEIELVTVQTVMNLLRGKNLDTTAQKNLKDVLDLPHQEERKANLTEEADLPLPSQGQSMRWRSGHEGKHYPRILGGSYLGCLLRGDPALVPEVLTPLGDLCAPGVGKDPWKVILLHQDRLMRCKSGHEEKLYLEIMIT